LWLGVGDGVGDQWGRVVIRLSPGAKDTKVTFAVPVSQVPGRCSVVGDFNQWQPGVHEMRRRGNGTRSVAISVPAGTRIRFRYLAENGHWFNDPDITELDGEDTSVTV